MVLSGFLLTGAVATGSLPNDAIPFRLPDTEKIEAISSIIARGEGDWSSVNRGYAGDTPGGMEQLFGKSCEEFSSLCHGLPVSIQSLIPRCQSR